MTIEEFADVANVTISIQRSPGSAGPWIASIRNGETKNDLLDTLLVGTAGRGKTPAEALADMTRGLLGKWLIVDARGSHPRKVPVPNRLVVA